MADEHRARKETPIYSGVHKYFPAALAGVSRVSVAGNRQHNGDDNLRDDRSKSNDDADCLLRHLEDAERGNGMDGDVPHIDKVAWRALRLSQKWHEARGADIAPAAVNLPKAPPPESLTLAAQIEAQAAGHTADGGGIVPESLAKALLRDVEREDDTGEPYPDPRPNPVSQEDEE